MSTPTKEEFEKLQAEVARLRLALCSALAWIGGSLGSPLSQDEVRRLIRMTEVD